MSELTQKEAKAIERFSEQFRERNMEPINHINAIRVALERAREAAAKKAEDQMDECNARPNCHLRDSALIRKMSLDELLEDGNGA